MTETPSDLPIAGSAPSTLSRSWTRVRSLAGHKRFQGYVMTVGVNASSAIVGLLTLRLAGTAFGETGFGLYQVSRRAASLLTFPLLMGMGVGLTRFISFGNAEGDSKERAGGYLGSALLLGVPLLVITSLLAFATPGGFTRLFLGGPDAASLVVPTLSAVVGLYFSTLIYGYFVGQSRMAPANLVKLGNIILLPALAVALSGRSVGRAQTVWGVGMAVSSIVWAASDLGLRRSPALFTPGTRRRIRELLKFGLPRVPGEIALFGLFAIPTILIASQRGLESAGRFSFGLSLIQICGGMFAAGGTVLLPMVGGMSASNRRGRIPLMMNRVIAATLLVSVTVSVAAVCAMTLILGVILGPQFTEAAGEARWLMLGIAPYALYQVLRGPLDALENWPHNTINLWLGLVVAMVPISLDLPWLAPQWGMLGGFLTVGVATLLSWFRCVNRLKAAETLGVAEPAGQS